MQNKTQVEYSTNNQVAELENLGDAHFNVAINLDTNTICIRGEKVESQDIELKATQRHKASNGVELKVSDKKLEFVYKGIRYAANWKDKPANTSKVKPL